MSGYGLVKRKAQADSHFLEKYDLFQLLRVPSNDALMRITLNCGSKHP